eukprot:TRINITY_DN9819_c0_g1_i1.p1 TRINITY_DN9819_c0_g1~~TRINITY_DN9819_c0_g1_i1.p1  ORF type:complete len:361 (-),score=162.72 TRINITY_DN9819_c0_g1_i1:55-1083(-)
MVEKRKFDDVEQETVKDVPVAPTNSRQMQGQGDNKHSIDSDDEEDDRQAEAKFEKLKDDDIEGQEDDTLADDGDIKITPFNLKEEQQEGSFSKDGNFVWNKKDEIKDAWLDDIDWMKVKAKSKAELEQEENEDDAEDSAQEAFNEIGNYKQMVELMRPGESVAKALRRLGGNKGFVSQSQRWKKKKAGAVEDPAEKENKEKMLKLTGLADAILSRSGNMEIYEETYEGILFKIKTEEEKKVGPKTSIPEGVDEDDALDMFADSLDDKSDKPSKEIKKPEAMLEEVMWEFKWKVEDSELHGPHPSQTMLDWQEGGYFTEGVLVRKVGGADFLDSKRIDFDLYT